MLPTESNVDDLPNDVVVTQWFPKKKKLTRELDTARAIILSDGGGLLPSDFIGHQNYISLRPLYDTCVIG